MFLDRVDARGFFACTEAVPFEAFQSNGRIHRKIPTGAHRGADYKPFAPDRDLLVRETPPTLRCEASF